MCGVQDPEDNVFIDLMDFSSIVADPEVGAVLCGLDMHINYKKIAKAFRYLRENEGCLFIATNLDSTFPTHGSVYPGSLSSPRTLFGACADLVLRRWRSYYCTLDVLPGAPTDRRWQAREGDDGLHPRSVRSFPYWRLGRLTLPARL